MVKDPKEDKIKETSEIVEVESDADVDAAVDDLIEELTTDTTDASDAPEPKEAEEKSKPEEPEGLEKSKDSEELVEKKVVILEDEIVDDSEEDTKPADAVEVEDEQVAVVDDAGSKTSEEEVTEVTEVDSLIEGHAEPGKASISAENPVATGVSDAVQEETIDKTISTSTKKKSKAPLVIFLCLLICAIAGAVTWFFLRSTPEAQVSDAIANLFTAKQVSTTGSINLKFDEDTNPDIRSVKLDLGITSDHIPASASATLSITTQSNSNFKIDLGETIARDGTIYLKVSGLQKAIDNAKVPGEVQAYLDYFEDVISATDDQWWMIAVPDLLDQISNTLDEDLDTNYADAYQCVLDQIADNDGSELANLYRQYPFIDVANYTGTELQPVTGGTLFSISVNKTQLKNFENELDNTAYQKSLQKCTAQITSDTATEDTLDEQVDDTLDTLSDLPPAYVEVTGFDHKLARFYYNYEADDFGSFEIDLRFSFPNTVSVDMPTKARAVTELVDAIVDGYTNMLYDIYSNYYLYTDCNSADNCTSDAVLN